MNRKELLLVSICVFLTVVAWMISDLYHIQNRSNLERQIRAARIPKYNIDVSAFEVLDSKKP